MNENKRTISYCVAAALAVVIAWEPWRSRPAEPDPAEAAQTLFSDFPVLSAKSLQVIKYDEDTSALSDFQVKQKKGLWSIPSHQDYPADAANHLAEAATSLLDLKPLGLASNKPGEHELYGVVNPDIQSLKPGMLGVGTRVIMKDGNDNTLIDLVIGKADKEQPNLRFVRRPTSDNVFRAIVKTDALTTRFGDWIEKDLLKLNTFDISEIQINDYSSQAMRTRDDSLGIHRLRRSRMKLGYDDAKSAWNLVELTQFEKDKPRSVKLKPQEELNSEKLNAMRTALDDLKIVDVERKPQGLSGDLRVTQEFIKDESGVDSLFTRGFIPVQGEDGRLEIISTEGEVITRMKDGAEYVLRFGQLAGKGDKAEKTAGDAPSGLNRYLFIMAQFNENLVPKPQLEPLPTAGEDAKSADKKERPETKKDKAAKGSAKAAAKSAVGAKAVDKKAVDKPEKSEADEAADKEAQAKEDKALADKRAEVEKENKRKQDEYQEKLKKGRDHVKELNDRFADWYYIISDEEYRKIHLGQSDVIKKKEVAAEKSTGPGQLDELEKEIKKK